MVSIAFTGIFQPLTYTQAKVDDSGYRLVGVMNVIHFSSHPFARNGLHAFYGPILGLYTDNATAPLNARAGLRQLYKFGLYSHCAYVNETAGKCTDTTAAYEFQPYTVITSDMLANYSGYTNDIIHNTAFFNSPSLGEHTHSAYYLLLLGTIGAIISIVASVPSCYRFLVSAYPLYLAQGSNQACRDRLYRHFFRRRIQYTHPCWFSPLDSCH